MNHINEDDGLVDTATEDIGTRKRKRRSTVDKRTRPDPPQDLKDREPELLRRAVARRRPPGIVRVKRKSGDGYRWSPPHNDTNLWELQLADCFGTRSEGAMRTFLRQLEALLDVQWEDEGDNGGHWWANEQQFAAVLDMVSGLKPKNTMEAALAAQMVAVHLLTMKVGAYAIQHSYDHRQASAMSRLARTFAEQTTAMQSLQMGRRRGSQTIKVKKETHQHVHYHHHRGDGDSGGQSHGRGDDIPAAEIADERPALPSPDASGNVVPLSGAKGKAKVQAARG
jgi:hypothetical protein